MSLRAKACERKRLRLNGFLTNSIASRELSSRDDIETKEPGRDGAEVKRKIFTPIGVFVGNWRVCSLCFGLLQFLHAPFSAAQYRCNNLHLRQRQVAPDGRAC